MPLDKILIATHNKGKFIEIKEIINTSLPLNFLSLNDLGIKEDVPEHGQTFAANAQIKAEFFGNLSNLPTIADDSGIIVEAIKNELGVETRRWGAGAKATDSEWISYFLARMSTEKNRRAEFVCNAAFYYQQECHIFEGMTYGIIENQLEANYLPGLPLSAVFKPDGYEKVFSALSVEEKNKISHRGKAFQKLRKYLEEVINTG
jgi:XTP/dITP diphosphohydrolase